MLKRRAGSSQPPFPTLQAEPVRKPSRAVAATPAELAASQSRILKFSLLVRFLSITLLILTSSLQQSFDTSHELLSYSLDAQTSHGLSLGSFNWLLTFVRWDTIYFLSSASPSTTRQHAGGYQWEQTLAFQPGIISILRITGYVTPSLDGMWSPTAALLLTTVLANLATLVGPVLLFRLGWRVVRDKKVAETAALLSIFAPSSGTTLTSPTPEPFFSIACLMGMLALENTNKQGSVGWGQVMFASISFAIATSFRANGVLLVAYIAFALLNRVRRDNHVVLLLKLVLGGTICIAPNVLFQTWAYTRFCLADHTRPWCENRWPSVYSFVQSHYWNVGFMRYWEVAQIPNFFLASPVLFMVGYAGWVFYRDSTAGQILASLIPFSSHGTEESRGKARGGFELHSSPKATPYIVYGIVLGLILLFASHIQIALRLATPGGMSMVWWGAAHAVLYCERMRKVVLGYLSIQYVVAIVLYAGFYPPA